MTTNDPRVAALNATPAAFGAAPLPEPEPTPEDEAAAEAAIARATLEDRDASDTPRIVLWEKGKPSICETVLASVYASRGRPLLLYATGAGWWLYNPDTGAWESITPEKVEKLLEGQLLQCEPENSHALILKKWSSSTRQGAARALRGELWEAQPFPTKKRCLHLADTMLHLTADGATPHPFGPEYRSRNPSPFPWRPEATCPRFLDELMSCLAPEDQSLLQRWAGSVLLTGNLAQRVLLIYGLGGGGKSTFVVIVQGLVGACNCAELRTQHLEDRFEMSRVASYTLLTSDDAPGNFLEQEGSRAIKKLTGGSPITGEVKGSNELLQFTGDKAVLITSNERLRVRLEGDTAAWERRLLIVEWPKRPAGQRRIDNFAQRLLEEEGPGIMAWAVEGARHYLREMETGGDFVLTETQRRRVTRLLCESESMIHWADECLDGREEASTATDALQQSYRAYCRRHDWEPLKREKFTKRLPDLLADLGATPTNHHMQGDTRVRGYLGVSLKGEGSHAAQ